MGTVQITLKPKARERALSALTVRGICPENSAEWFGPTFTDVRQLTIEEGFVMVLLEDNTNYLYPASSVARIKTQGGYSRDTDLRG